MMIYNVPGLGEVELKTIILDFNGTLSIGGAIPEGVQPRIQKLKELGFRIVLFTGNTRGDAEQIATSLGIEWKQAQTAEEKAELAKDYDPASCVSIGNGLIDIELMKVVALRIVTLQAEGVHVQTLMASDAVVPHINDALDMLLDPNRLIATFRQ
jgi:soluble P-type ATPase